MPIIELRLLPPFAIGRFGSSPNLLEAFELKVNPDAPLDYRRIEPRESFEVDSASGKIIRKYTPERIRFRDGEHIRPVAPFLEVFALTSDDVLEPLTLSLLAAEGLDPQSVYWSVTVGNLKVFRQTQDDHDQILALVSAFNNHETQALLGKCANFRMDRYIPFGNVRYICPTPEFPEIRLRFTPGTGTIYGSSLERFNPATKSWETDPVFNGDDSRIIYDTKKGKWLNFQADDQSPTLPNPSDIYENYPDPAGHLGFSRGYLDDVCDGVVQVELRCKDGRILKSRAQISGCMPVFAPDSQPIRTVADELEQLILGPEVPDEEVSIDAAGEIVRRALETIRAMNTQVMNGNVIEGRANIAHTLGTQDTNDHGRIYAPIMASSLVDNLAVRTLHERIYTALKSGTAPWFASALRQPEEIGDLSDEGRRKMPPMLRGADSRTLTLTRRQISKIVKAATSGIFAKPNDKP